MSLRKAGCILDEAQDGATIKTCSEAQHVGIGRVALVPLSFGILSITL